MKRAKPESESSDLPRACGHACAIPGAILHEKNEESDSSETQLTSMLMNRATPDVLQDRKSATQEI